MGLCETYRKGEGLSSIKGGHYLYESGKNEDCPNAKGVALLINSMIKDCVSNTKTYSDRVIKLDLNLQGQKQSTIIMAYMPTSSSTEEELEAVYEKVEEAVKDSKAKHKILIGDFNAKIGTNDKDNLKCMAPHGVGSRNRRG